MATPHLPSGPSSLATNGRMTGSHFVPTRDSVCPSFGYSGGFRTSTFAAPLARPSTARAWKISRHLSPLLIAPFTVAPSCTLHEFAGCFAILKRQYSVHGASFAWIFAAD